MKLHNPTSSRISRTVLTLGIAFLLAALASVVFVAAQNDNNHPETLTPANLTPADAPAKARLAEKFGKLPLSFEENQGQIDQQVKFLSHGPGYDLFLTSTDAVLRVQNPRASQADKSKQPAGDGENVRAGTVLRLKMLGANATPQVEGQEELPGRVNYFIGNNPEKWRRNIRTYKKAYFKDIYPGIDVVYYGSQRELEYDFVVGVGANPKLIRFSVDGADRIRLDKTGKLLLALKQGEVSLNKPVIYQLDPNGIRREVKGTYVINGNEVRFRLDRFDSSKPLVIDPVLSYSTLLGSSNNDQTSAIAVDSQGNAYVTGTTEFTGFPTTAGAFKTTPTRGGAFVTKLDPTGSSLVYSTYLNGNNPGFTNGFGIAVDSAGNAHITGSTSSSDFPVVNGLKTTSSFFKTIDAAENWNNQNSGLAGDAIAIVVAPNAANIIYEATTDGIYRSTDGGATWTKGTGTGLQSGSFISGMAVHPTNSSTLFMGVFSGLLKSTDGGNTWNPVVTAPLTFGTISCIVFDPSTPSTMYVGAGNGAFKSTDSGATWVTQNNFGIPGTPNVRAIAIDPTAPLTIYAGTLGSGFFKSTNGGSVWTAMNNGMGGPSPTVINTIVIDPANSATIYTGHGSTGGINKSTNGATSWTPLTNGIPQFSQVNTMAATTSGVFAAVGNTGIIKTTNGGTNWTPANTGLWNLSVRAIVPHPTNGSILYVGTGTSFSSDCFVTKLNASGSGILFSTLLGGSNEENGNGIAVDGNGNIYIAGLTTSTNFPVVNAAQGAPTITSCNDAFVAKLNPSAPSYVYSTYLRGGSCDSANAIAVDASGNAYITGSTSSNDFLTANAFQPALAQSSSGDAFVTKLNPTGSPIYSSYLGGTGSFEAGWGIAADASGNAYVTGNTDSSNFPTVNPIQASAAGGSQGDAFVTKLNSQGSALIYSTYLGGVQSDVGRSVAIDSANNAYVTGTTDSGDFPVTVGAVRTRSSLYKSVDSAGTWSNDNYGFTATGCCGNSEVNLLVIDPTAPSTIYAGSGVGVFKSTNGGRTWSAMNNGLSVALNVAGLAIDPLTPSTVYIAVNNFGLGSRGVYKSTNGGGLWVQHSIGLPSFDPSSLAIDPVTPNVLYVSVGCCFSGSHIYKTTDSADNWSPLAGAPPQQPTFLVVDPLNHSIIYALESNSPGGIFKSGDGGTSWQSLGTTVQGARSISVSPHTAGLLYANTDQTLFKSVDGGTSWTPVPPKTGKVVFDPATPSTLYLITSPFFSNSEGLFKSTDNGQTWKQVNKGLNVPQVRALAVDPVRSSTLHLAITPPSGTDAFVTKINAAGNSLVYSTFIGGPINPSGFSSVDAQAFGVAVDGSGSAYVTGSTMSLDFPVTPGSYQPFNRGVQDAFISKLSTSYLISGHVLANGATPLSGAEVVLNDGGSLTSVLSEDDGSYQFSRLREGGHYTVSASKPHFTITPASQTFNNLNSDQVLDFTATASASQFFTISGKVSENGVGLAGVKVTLSGSQPGLRTTDSGGNYSFELVAGGNYTITPSLLGFNFASAQTFNNLGANQIADFAATRQSFVVTNVNNHGAGSLRDAIINANATIGTDTISFNIPGPGVQVISLLIALPDLTDPVVIDATTQPGYAGTPLIELDGTGLGTSTVNSSGLNIKVGGSTVRGLSIVNFRGGSGIALNNCDNNVIQGNYIGVGANGTTVKQNQRGIQLTNSSNNLIGGTTAAARNVISGNSLNALEINGGNANAIQGNFIGTNAAGTAELHNSTAVAIFNATSIDNLIGGTAAGAGNLISGNQGGGIITNGNSTRIQGNLIGTDVTGTKKIPNTTGISANGQNILIGGVTAGARNVISGNSSEGVNIRGTGSKVQGNYIGTDITGTLALGNSANGVSAVEGALIGGTEPGARNIISANGSFGNNGNVSLGFTNTNVGATVQGNYIGTDVTGTKALGGSSPGIVITTNNHTVGGLVPEARNLISGNSVGIRFFSTTVGNVIQGNFIGLNAAGTGPLPNNQQGIAINGAVNNTIGGSQIEAANKIAFNGGGGITISGNAQGNSIRGNSIFSNNGLGIDLGANGVTANDGSDPDTGPNNLQNFPVITGVMLSSNSTTIQGTLKSLSNTAFQIDFYSNGSVDPSGNGEGAQFFNTTSVTTDGNGDATINATFPIALPAGRVITATATDPNGNTSEFSAADSSGATGSVHFAATSVQVIEDVGSLSVTVVRTGGTTGNLSVDYATTDGTAIAGQDYTSASGTLTFTGGETTKTIQIPIADDAMTETDETFSISLGTANLEALGAPVKLVVTVQDHDTVPTIRVDGVNVVEGNAGNTTDALFTISLSAATGRAVSVDFTTVNAGALSGSSCNNAGVDYLSASGTLSFTPSVTAFTIPIKICGDNNAEGGEAFGVSLLNPNGATLAAPGFSFVVIEDDDPLQLLLEESGPIAGQVVALDALLALRDPFRVQGIPEWYSTGPDRNTRVAFFARNLQLNPGESPSDVQVILIQNSNGVFHFASAEAVSVIPNSEFTEVVIRLPNTLVAGTYTVQILAHGQTSNTGTIRIAP
jgi:Calx-beta domain-containing protein/beta-propeller repeat-containing protein/carboxypeptidase family protein